MHHNLQLSSRNEDPPHAKISSDIISCIFLVSFFYYIFYRRCNLNFKDDIFLDTIGMLKNNHIVHWLVHIENTKSVWKEMPPRSWPKESHFKFAYLLQIYYNKCSIQIVGISIYFLHTTYFIHRIYARIYV